MIEDWQWIFAAARNLAQIQRVQHESVAALQRLEEVLTLARERSLTWLLPSILIGLALTATDLGHIARAIDLFHESLSLAIVKGNHGSVIDGIEGLARVAAATGQAEAAVRLFAAGDALRAKLTFPLSPTEIAYAAPIMSRLRTVLGAEGFAAAWADGGSLSQQAAVEAALALRVDADAAQTAAAECFASAHGLTSREFEILRLIAAGQSNREIAAGLFISYATVARHCANLFGKLDIDSRSKATAYAHQHEIA